MRVPSPCDRSDARRRVSELPLLDPAGHGSGRGTPTGSERNRARGRIPPPIHDTHVEDGGANRYHFFFVSFRLFRVFLVVVFWSPFLEERGAGGIAATLLQPLLIAVTIRRVHEPGLPGAAWP